ncbi:GntR family transcriptional regulator [Streptomyces sp. NBS 14/10]|uniref:GntR family transcriptional regulator n=1 Tax=Streptomyces sp. NBS 14/10 TaxID=1945643 RepID=UPI000B7D9568|nr:GntR family transcriptional regulator [Streptomyces sp. NBS 14/10]KAK1186294.1 GntR family transcriptional regulator [Streptomyces sp. NBS 14/10]NUS85091.1 GntR family transcriptional regulator [Streptomyces sp.]
MAGGRRISAHAVCTAIRDDIVSGTFAPGSRLIEEFLARRYGVSRVPVREALRTLESEGFVTTRRHAGACVAQPSEREAADLLDIRALLEPLGAARAAQRRSEAHLKVLRGLVRLGQERARRGQLGELRPLGDWFHETLAQASGSPSLAGLLVQLRRKIAWVYAVEPAHRQAPSAPGTVLRSDFSLRAVASWDEHGALVDAVARGDADRARALAAAHAERSMSEYRLRRPVRVRSSKHSVNTAGVRN